MQFRLWTNPGPDSYITFLFIGARLYKKHEKTLKKIQESKKLSEDEFATVASDIPAKLWKNEKAVAFIDKTIYKDDNIYILLNRLCVYLKKQEWFHDSCPDDVYMWVERKVMKTPSLVAMFVNNCFENQTRILFSDFKRATKNFFGITLDSIDYVLIDNVSAFKMLMAVEITKIIDPIVFKYTYNEYFKYIQYDPLTSNEDEDVQGFNLNSYSAMTLQSFGEVDRINIILYKNFNHMPWYFPYRTKPGKIGDIVSFINDLDKIEESLDIDTSNCTHRENISYLAFKVNEVNLNYKHDLGRAFNVFNTHSDIPFIKLKTLTNVYYKVDKEFVKNKNNYENHWTKWTELTGMTRKFADHTSITFKIVFKTDSYCTFTISDHFVYEVKFNVGRNKKTLIKEIYDFCSEQLNSILKQFRVIYTDAFIPDITPEQMDIVHVNATDVIALAKQTIKYDNFKNVVSEVMFPYFNIIPSKERNIILLQYKKVDNYLKYDNITDFILQRPSVSKEDMINEMAAWFRISKGEAEKEYEKREGEIAMKAMNDGGKKIFRTKVDGFVNIRIKVLSPVDMEFEVSGFKYFETHARIVELLMVLVNLTNITIDIDLDAKKIEKQLDDIKHDENEITLKDVDKDNVLSEDVDVDNLDQKEKQHYAEASGEPMVDNIFLKFLEDVPDEDPAVLAAAPPPAVLDPTPDEKQKKFSSKFLEQADPELFNYPAGKNQGYKTKCTGRFPVLITKTQKLLIDEAYADSNSKPYKNFLRVGSTPELAKKNYYICPDVWCPKSMMAMTKQQYDQNKCPLPNEEGIEGKPGFGYVGVFPADLHPNKVCLPCCFKTDTSVLSGKQRLDECKKNMPEYIFIGDEEESAKKVEVLEETEEYVGNMKYVHGEKKWPLNPDYLGLLPQDLTKILGDRKCGIRHDGSGNLKMDSDGFLRIGTREKNQSFLSCIVRVLDNEDIKDVASLVEYIKLKLTVDVFLGLENGKLLKAFVNDRVSIFDADDFQEFVQWFIHIDQYKYILKHNLAKVYRSLLKCAEGLPFTKELRHYKDIIREFMIYYAYKNFLEYISSKQHKDHRALLDLFNSENQHLNIKNVNILVISVIDDKLTIQCPINKMQYNINHPFAFILFNGTNYELLTHLIFSKEVDARFVKFHYKSTLPEMRELINFVMNNCLEKGYSDTALTDIELATKLKAKYLVLDYGFKAKGVLLKENVYVPFKERLALFNLKKKKFIYYSDLVNYKCSVDAAKIYEDLTTLDKFYQVKEKNEQYLLLKNDIVIPLDLDNKSVKYEVFENDIDIFIEYEKDDSRKNVIAVMNENRKLFSMFLNAVITYITSHPDIKKEVDFLTDFANPFPVNLKRKKMAEIMSEIIGKIIVKPDDEEGEKVIENICKENGKDCVSPCPDGDGDACLVGLPKEKIEEFRIKVSEQLLINSMYYETKTKTYRHAPSELLFGHHELILGQHMDAIMRLQDPLKILNEKLDEEFGEYVFTQSKTVPMEPIYKFIGTPEFKDNYNKFDKYIRYTYVVDAPYDNLYIYRWFEVLNKCINDGKVDALYLKNIVKNHIINDYEENQIEPFVTSKCFQKLWASYKKIKKVETLMMMKPTLPMSLELFDSLQYYPSLYELRILSEFVGVNVIIFTRKTKENDEGLELIDNDSSNYILLHHAYDNKGFIDVYSIVGLYHENPKAVETLNYGKIKYILDKSHVSKL